MTYLISDFCSYTLNTQNLVQEKFSSLKLYLDQSFTLYGRLHLKMSPIVADYSQNDCIRYRFFLTQWKKRDYVGWKSRTI